MSETLAQLLDDAWSRIDDAIGARGAPFRTPVLATVATNACARARVVILRGADRAAGRLEIHTDAASSKVAEVSGNPLGTLVFWDPADEVQVRIEARLAARSGTAEEWARVPDPSRRAYGGAPAPGTPIPAPEAFDPAPDPSRFTVLTAEVRTIDILRLGRPHHLRARFEAPDGFAGRWIVP